MGRPNKLSASKKPQRGKKNFKSNSPEDRKMVRYEKEGLQETKSNDPAWYSVDPALLRDSASFPYSWPVGTSVNIRPNYTVNGVTPDQPLVQGYVNDYYIPGIATFWLVPSFGHSDNASSALNLASQQLYTFVRHMNSGSANYDAVDLMLYIASMASVYSFINFLQRLYGTASLYAQKNRYLPKALFESQGVNYEDVSSNLANFRYRLNLLINKTASFAVPANIAYFKRQAFNYSAIYTEGESIKDQLYLQVPARMFQFGLDADGAGCINAVVTPMYSHFLANPTRLATTDDLFNFADSLITPLLYSEDFGIMNGDILKAYGRDNIITLSEVAPDYMVVPKFDLKVLEQMTNATLLDFFSRRSTTSPAGTSPFEGYVHQDSTKGFLITNTKFRIPIAANTSFYDVSQAFGWIAFSGAKIISTHAADPDADITVENTRLAAVVKSIDFHQETGAQQPDYIDVDISAGSDILTYVGINCFTKPGVSVNTVLHSNTRVYTDNVGAAAILIPALALASNFEFLPQIFATVNGAPDTMYSIWDIGNYTVLHPQDGERLHETCLMSLLHVAQIAKLS